MGLLGGRRLLSLAGLATVIVAPLSILGWQSKNDGDHNSAVPNAASAQNQQTQHPQAGQAADLQQTGQASSSDDPQSSSSSSNTSVTINGQQIPLPSDGILHKVIENSNGTTTLDVSVSNDVSGTTGSSYSQNSINLYSQSETVVDGQSSSN